MMRSTLLGTYKPLGYTGISPRRAAATWALAGSRRPVSSVPDASRSKVAVVKARFICLVADASARVNRRATPGNIGTFMLTLETVTRHHRWPAPHPRHRGTVAGRIHARRPGMRGPACTGPCHHSAPDHRHFGPTGAGVWTQYIKDRNSPRRPCLADGAMLGNHEASPRAMAFVRKARWPQPATRVGARPSVAALAETAVGHAQVIGGSAATRHCHQVPTRAGEIANC